MNTRAWMRLVLAALLCLCASQVLSQALAPRAAELLEQERPRTRDQWFHDIRAYPNKRLTPGARLKALAQREALSREQQRIATRRVQAAAVLGRDTVAAAAVTPSWTSIGPQPAQTIFTPIPAGNSGRATAIAIDPTVPTTVYLGTADGGVWKSTDAGGHWLELTDTQPSLAVGSLTLDPSDPQTIYVGTGEANFSGDSYFGAGVLKSIDGGATWITLAGLPSDHVAAVAISPVNRNLLLVCGDSGVWRGTQVTATTHDWVNVLGRQNFQFGICNSAFFDPRNPNIAYAAFGSNYSDFPVVGIFRSSDAGQTWAPLNGTAPNMLPAGSGRLRLVMDPSNSATLYVAVAAPYPAKSPAGLYKSVDAGLNWTPLTSPVAGQPAECCDWYGDLLAVSPANPKLLYAGAGSLVQSLDGGVSWTAVGGYEQPAGLGDPVHPDQHAIAFTPGGATMYLANDGGIYKATAPGAAMNWQSLNTTLSTIQFYAGVAIDPRNLQRTLAGTQDNGSLLYTGSLRWNGTFTCGDGGYALFDYLNSQTMYIACSAAQGVFKSVDGGNTWFRAATGIDFSEYAYWTPPLAMDPSNPQVLYYGADHTYQSIDGGMSWQNISGSLGLHIGPIATIAVAPTDPNTVYVGRPGNAVDVTSNALAGAAIAWTETTATPMPWQIAVDPRDAASAVLLSFWSVARTTDRGATWTDTGGNLPQVFSSAILIDPDLLNTYYVANDVGVFYSVDAGQGWQVLGQGLPNVVATGLALDPGSRTLRAVTHGRGAWDLVLDVPVFGVGPPSLAFGDQLVQVPSAVTALTFSNNQPQAALAVSAIAVVGDFKQTNNCGTTLGAGASCKINISFLPTVTGSRPGSVTVTTAAGAQTVALDGNGVLPSAVVSANAGTITALQPVLLTWSANAVACTGTGGVSGDGWAGARPLSGTMTVTAPPTAAGPVSYGLACTAGPNSAQAQTSVTYTVPSVSVTAAPASITVTRSTTVTWNSASASACTASGGTSGDGWGGSLALTGTKAVTEPAVGAQTFTVTCTAFTLTASGQALVNFVAPTATLSASASSAQTTTSVTLSWSSTGNSCAATGGASGDGWSGALAVSGTQTVTERSAGSYSYGITCTAAALSAQAQATVAFTNPPSSGGGAIDALALLTLALVAIARRRA